MALSAFLAAALLPSVAAQPLAGGGGGDSGGYYGGGFDYDGGSDDESIGSMPSCPPNCLSCVTDDDVCDVCYSGYGLTRDGRCVSCPSNCKRCDVAGPGKCDVCMDRYVLVSPLLSRRCEPCADHCKKCGVAGARKCDENQCDGGHMLHLPSKACKACTSNCRVCHDTSDSGCDQCRMFYRLDGGGCKLDTKFLIQIVVSIIACVVATKLLWRCRRVSRQRRPREGGATHEEHRLQFFFQQPSQEAFVAAAAGLRTTGQAETLPSGVWRGYYTLSGVQHDVCEFTLEFGPNGTVIGGGVDDVGEYTINGLCGGSSMLAFTKTYSRQSRNVMGVVSYGNKGHSVEYRGELASASGALGGGFRGAWRIRHEIGNHDGTFHLWPAMEGWHDPELEVVDGGDPARQTAFEVESECVVCFDRPITTCLRPCGHQALCRPCANQLRSPRTCPLCRTRIDLISDHIG